MLTNSARGARQVAQGAWRCCACVTSLLDSAASTSQAAHYHAPAMGTWRTNSAVHPPTSMLPSTYSILQHGPQRRSMFIQTQTTPNPASLMFLPGQSIMGAEGGTKHFGSAREGMASPLAKRLFMIDGVSGVFFGTDFVTVTKRDDYSWAVLKPDIFAAIMDHFAGGDPLFLDQESMQASDTAIDEDDDEVVAMIKELLDTRIRPAVRDDGGDIVYKGFDVDSGTVYLKMQGACSGCPSSSVTLKSGIENMLMHYVPEVRQVLEAPPDEGEEEGLRAFAKLESQLST